MAYWLRIDADPPACARRADGYIQGALWALCLGAGSLIGCGLAWGIVA